MKFLTDQDVFATPVRFLSGLGHDMVTAAQLGLALAEDAERKEYDSYRESADGSATLADLFHAKDNS